MRNDWPIINQVILWSKIFNYLQFIFYFGLLVLDVILLTSKTSEIAKYSGYNFVAIVLHLIPTFYVGHRLNHIKQNSDQNFYCLEGFAQFQIYLDYSDELTIITYLNHISTYSQLFFLEFYQKTFLYDFNTLYNSLLFFFQTFYRVLSVWKAGKAFTYAIGFEEFATRYYENYTQQQKKKEGYDLVITQAYIFLSLCFPYCLAKLISCVIIITITDQLYMILLCSSMITIAVVQIVCIFRIILILKNISKSFTQMKLNHNCFMNYWFFLETLMRSKKLIIQYYLLCLLYLIQMGLGIRIMILNIEVDFQYYAVIDSFITSIFVAYKLIKRLFVYCKKFEPIFIFYSEQKIQRLETEARQIIEQEIFQQKPIEQQIKELISQGIYCCICLQQLLDPQLIKHLICDFRHQFHIQCIDNWLTFHSTCPLCQQKVK